MFGLRNRRKNKSNGIKTLSRRWKPVMETLEDRTVPTVSPQFIGPFGLSVGPLTNISQSGGNQTEGSIAIDPRNPSNIFAVSNPGTSAAISTNAASTFANYNGSPTANSGGENKSAWDNFGNLFNVYIDFGGDGVAGGGDDSVILARSSTGAAGSFAVVSTIKTGNVKEPSVAVGHNSVWVTWRDATDIKARGASVTGLGLIGAFSTEQSAFGSNNIGGHFPDIAVNPVTGAVVVSYATGSHVYANTDADGLGAGGFTFLTVVQQNGFVNFDYPIPAQPERTITAQANLAYGPNGALYVVYTDVGGGGVDDTDIFFQRSLDNGLTWSSRVEVTDELGNNSQFLPNIAVDPNTGFIAVSWYDARFDNGQNDGIDDNDGVQNNEANVFASVSTDGGLTFLPNQVLTPSASSANVAPVGSFDFGDYTGLAFFGGVFRPVWGDNSNSTGNNPGGKLGTLDLYTTGVRVTSGSEVINVTGDEQFNNQDDTFLIKLDSTGTFIQFFVNGVLEFTAAKATVTQINVDGFGGNDNLVVDSSNGLISIPNGIRYNGGNGFDRLTLQQTGGATQTSDTYSVGANLGDGTDVIVGPSGTQTVFFQGLEPVTDNVPAATVTVNATNADNAINYAQGPGGGIFVGNTGLMTIDNQESYEFNNKTNLVINGQAGSDTINLNNPVVPAGLTGTITVNGGDPTGSDTLIANSEGRNLLLEPTALGAGTVTYFGGGLPNTPFAGIEHLTLVDTATNPFGIDGTAGDDQFVYIPGATPDTGTVVGTMNSGGSQFPLVPTTFVNMQQAGVIVFNTFGQQGGTDSFFFNGTAGNDNISVTNGGVFGGITLSDTVNSSLFANLNLNNMASGVTVQGNDGDDTFNHDGAVAFPLSYNGGNPSGSDVLNLTGATGVAQNVSISPSASDATKQTVTGLAGSISVSGTEVIRFTGSGGDDTLNVFTGSGDDTVRVQRGNNFDQVISNSLPLVEYTGLNTFVVDLGAGTDQVTFATHFLAGALAGNYRVASGSADTLIIEGRNGGDDNYTVAKGPSVVSVVDNSTGVTVQDNTGFLGRLQINTLGGDDSVTVNSAGGAVTVPIVYDGGSGRDALSLTGGTATSDTYTPGLGAGQGVSLIVLGGITQNVSFVNLEPVFDSVAGPLTTVANNADNAINYKTGSDTPANYFAGVTNTAWGEVSIDGFETIEFTNKTSLTINAGAGSDTINLNNPNTPAGLTGTINVNGADPTGSDTLIMNSVGRNLVLEPTALGAGTVNYFGGGIPSTPFTGIEHLTLVDTATNPFGIDGTAGNDQFVYIPGATPDTGTVVGTMNSGGAQFPLVPTTFIGMQQAGVVVFNTFGQQGGTDTFVFNGTAASDVTSMVNGGVFGGVTLSDTVNGSLFANLNLNNMAGVTVQGNDGNDVFNHSGAVTIPVTYAGGSSATGDVLAFTSTGTGVTADLGGQTVAQAGGGLVSFLGVETLNVNAGASTLTVLGTTGADTIAATPTGVNSVAVQAYSGGTAQNGQGGNLASLTPLVPAINASNVTGAAGGFTVNGNGGSDQLFVEGSQNGETIEVNHTVANAVVVGGRLAVNYSATIPFVEVDALAGDDTINIAPSITTSFLVDGGAPIGTTPGDQIVLFPVGIFSVQTGPHADEGGLVDNGFQRISWDNIEKVTSVGGGPTIILGSSEDDDITVIAIDATTDPLADGVQDFVVSVSDQLDVTFINQPNLLIDSLAGDDDIVVREPAPNLAVWNVQIVVAGGTPTALVDPLGDTLQLETPGNQNVTYTPRPAPGVIPAIPGVTFPAASASDTFQFNDATNTSKITAIPFSLSVPGFSYVSSPGGVEHAVYHGIGGNDNLTFNSPSNGGALANDIIYTPGATADSGSIASRLLGGGTTLVPLTFAGLGANGTITYTTANPGGGRVDLLEINGTSSSDVFQVNGAGNGSVQLFKIGSGSVFESVVMNTNAIDSLLLHSQGGIDTFNLVGGLPYTNTTIDADATLNLSGATGAIAVNLGPNTITGYGGTIALSGVDVVNMTAGGNTLTVVGTAGDDTFNFTPSAAGAGSFTATWTGAAVGASPLFTYTGVGASITANGGAGGFDTLGLTATAGNDNINAVQNSATALAYSQNAFTVNFTLTVMEGAVLDAGNGDDLIRVSVADALEAAPAGSLAYLVHGGSGNDRLVVNDDGIGDLTILRQIDGQSGNAVVGVLKPITYDSAERLDVTPVNNLTGGTGTDGNGRIKVFHADPFESNDTRLFAGQLSRVGSAPNSPNIDSAAIINPFAVGGDEDWYEFRPQQTGTFNIRIVFDKIAALANGRPGLPGAGDLSLDIYDANGVLIVSGVTVTDGKSATFAATNDPSFPQFNRIYVRVRGATPASVNVYDFSPLGAAFAQVDNEGPQVTNVQISDFPGYNIFGLKPFNQLQGPTPLVNSLTISFQDQPARTSGFLYSALDFLTASTPGMYVLKGDRVGTIAINSIVVTNDPVVLGQVPTASVQLFFNAPLPDDHYTLTISDHILDPAGNKLDGESNAAEPNEGPTFPSGDGHPSGKFIAAFVVDSRPELGFYGNGSVNLDINGNYIVDPNPISGPDAIVAYGPNGSAVFAGQFAPVDAFGVNGFDRLGTYGLENKKYVFRLDFNDDGDFNDPGERIVNITQVNGMPISGNWTFAHAGSEVGVFTGTKWYLDTDGNNMINPGDAVLTGNMRGLPITGDFDGDGLTDLATYQIGFFYFDLAANGLTGNADTSFRIQGFPGLANGLSTKLTRPVAADLDGDGITDVGLFMPNQTNPAKYQANWFMLVSNDPFGDNRIIGTVNTLNHPFQSNQFPGGSGDFSATYGSSKALPILGNFDPPRKASANSVANAAAAYGSTMAKNLADMAFANNIDPITGKPKTTIVK